MVIAQHYEFSLILNAVTFSSFKNPAFSVFPERFQRNPSSN